MPAIPRRNYKKRGLRGGIDRGSREVYVEIEKWKAENILSFFQEWQNTLAEQIFIFFANGQRGFRKIC